MRVLALRLLEGRGARSIACFEDAGGDFLDPDHVLDLTSPCGAGHVINEQPKHSGRQQVVTS